MFDVGNGRGSPGVHCGNKSISLAGYNTCRSSTRHTIQAQSDFIQSLSSTEKTSDPINSVRESRCLVIGSN